MTDEQNLSLETELTADIVSAYVSNNPVAADQLTGLIGSVFESVAALSTGGVEPVAERPEPAVSVRKSLRDDHLVCLEDGKKFKSLKRHLRTSHGLTPAEYRERWDLKPDYPMVAPAYAEQRSKLAKDIGLGQKRKK